MFNNNDNNTTNLELPVLFHYNKQEQEIAMHKLQVQQHQQHINNMSQIEEILPNIYLTKDFTIWNEQNSQIKAFTHIIIIDKHIQEFYYSTNSANKIPARELEENKAFDLNSNDNEYSTAQLSNATLSFDNDIEVLNLNFGEKSYLTTVLPNCYRAVCFMDKALQSNGNILVIDCNGSEQKCITIVVAYLMYKHNLSFSAAFERFKSFYKNADLDRFYMNQLYEYEPILQVQREHSRGQCCSREMHAAILKRKKKIEIDEPSISIQDQQQLPLQQHSQPQLRQTYRSDILATFNPLSQFKLNMPKSQDIPTNNFIK